MGEGGGGCLPDHTMTECWGNAGGLTRKPFASRIPYNVARAPVLINLYFKPPNPKPRLRAGSKPKAEHTLQILPKPLSTRSLIPFNRKPKSHKLKLNPKPQNPTTTPQGEEAPHPTPQGRGGPHPISGPFSFGGGGGGGAAERVTMDFGFRDV